MIYGERDDPYTVLNILEQRLETAIALDEIVPTILRTIREAMKVSYVKISFWRPEHDAFDVVAEEGLSVPIVLTLPLTNQNETVGQLQLSSRVGDKLFFVCGLALA